MGSASVAEIEQALSRVDCDIGFRQPGAVRRCSFTHTLAFDHSAKRR